MSSPTQSSDQKIIHNIAIISIAFVSLLFSLLLLIMSLEMLKIYQPQSIETMVIEHNKAMENISNYTPIFQEKIKFYINLFDKIWVLWAIPIAGLFLTIIMVITQNRSRSLGAIKSQIIHNRDLFYVERRRKKRAMDELDGVLTHLEKFHENLDNYFMVISSDDKIIQLNNNALEFLKTATKSSKHIKNFEGLPVREVMPGYMTSGMGSLVQEVINRGSTITHEVFFEPLDKWFYINIFEAVEHQGAAYVYFKDITETKTSDNMLQVSEKLLRTISNSAPIAIAVVDMQWNYLLVSNVWQENFCLGEGDLRGKNHRELLPRLPENWSEVEANIKDGKPAHSDGIPLHINGHEEWVSWEIKQWKAPDGRVGGYIIYAQIVTEARQNRERADQQRKREHKLAYHDILTGLPNRQLFYDRLNMSLAQAYRHLSQVSLLFLDLDGFKAVNDNLGHDVGDILLKEVSGRLAKCIRDSDTLARLGGDEFTIILSDIDGVENVAKVAQKILDSVAEPFFISGNQVNIGTSIGISMYPQDGSSTSDLIKKADTAMYRSKESGKNRYTFFNEDVATSNRNGKNGKDIQKDKTKTSAKKHGSDRETDIKDQLKVAIQKGEMEVYFQPQYNLENRTIFGLEALIRWNHPTMGLLTPGQFLNVAEKTGLILPIGEWVLTTACQRNTAWMAEMKEKFRVTVNFSMRQLEDSNFVSRVRKSLQTANMLPTYLGIEISEEVIMANSPAIKEKLRQLKNLGVYIIIDDFGIGYSPITHIKEFPIDMIKIHKSFIQKAVQNEEDRAIVKTIIALAENLDIEVLGEGVETEEQEDMLLNAGCKNVQGFLYSRPLQPLDAEAFFTPLRISPEQK